MENDDKKKECVDGAQRNGDLWRVSLNDKTLKISLLSQGITLTRQHVELKDRHPLIIMAIH